MSDSALTKEEIDELLANVEGGGNMKDHKSEVSVFDTIHGCCERTEPGTAEITLIGGKAVELMVVHGICMKRVDADNEGDEYLVWWSEHCCCFHWAYNKEFRGMYTGSFINMVPCGVGKPSALK